MSKQELASIVKAMVAPGKGLLAMDESNSSCLHSHLGSQD
jgi:fructose-bisphosphate aldolase class 1